MNPYDDKAFEITTPDPGAPGAGYLAPVDGSAAALRIMGAEHGGRYTLDSGSGKAESSIEGPWVGPELDEFYAKRGGIEAHGEQPHVDPYPGWTLSEYLAPLPEPVRGGPNAGPDREPTLKQVGSTIEPMKPDQPDPAPPAPIASTPSAVPVGAPLPPAHVAIHESVVQRALAIAHELEHGIECAPRAAARELAALFHHLHL